MCCIVTSMSVGIVIRRVKPIENDSVHALVQAIADETFAYLFAPSQVPSGRPIGSPLGWHSRRRDFGVTMTQGEWVSDLWVRRDSRRAGIGGELLAHAEREIRSRGHDALRLRVVKSNTRAVEFIKITAGEFSVNFRMKSSATRCSK